MYVFYGFDKIGYELPEKMIFRDREVKFIRFDDTDFNWLKIDGIVVPNGIFEKIEDSIMSSYISYNADLLLEIEKKVHNLTSKGKWVCILNIQKNITHCNRDEVSHTDLAKKLLINIEADSRAIQPFPVSNTKYDQFRFYLKEYGVAKNLFSYYGSDKSNITIISGKDYYEMYAFTFINRIFFLPFHSTKRTKTALQNLSKLLLAPIEDYVKIQEKSLPKWLDEFEFITEKTLQDEKEKYEKLLSKINTQLKTWNEYKSILTTTGETLRETLIQIFTDIFKFKLNPIDNNIEDFKLLSDDGEVITFCEVKGTKKGIKREYINQLDSHRERHEIDSTIPGLLLINNEMGKSSIDKRLETTVPEQHIKHAKKLNVLIIRTIDLLFLIKLFEDGEFTVDNFIEYLGQGGGWLKVDENGVQFI